MGCGGEGSSHRFVLGPMGLAVTLYREGSGQPREGLGGQRCSQVWAPDNSLWLPWQQRARLVWLSVGVMENTGQPWKPRG